MPRPSIHRSPDAAPDAQAIDPQRDRLRVAYTYELPAEDINVQSARPYSTLQQLRRRASVTLLSPLDDWTRYLFGPKYLWYRATGRIYRPDREALLLAQYGQQLRRWLANQKVDCLYSPGTRAVAALGGDLPLVLCADATFANMVDTYDTFTNCAAAYIRQGHRQEKRALDRCAAIIYPSSWAAESAMSAYRVAPDKVHIVPFGANVDAPDTLAVQRMINERDTRTFRVLFIGRDWERKGAPLVLDACRTALGAGVPLRLDMVGIGTPPVTLPDFATSHGMLRKNNPGQLERFRGLLAQAHVLFVPSRAEAYGMTFCEAAAYGVPSLATAVGGIPAVVRNDRTGFSLPPEADAAAYAAVLRDLHHDRARWRALAMCARRDYEANFTWDRFGERLIDIMRQVV